jgi:hypothetical protein
MGFEPILSRFLVASLFQWGYPPKKFVYGRGDSNSRLPVFETDPSSDWGTADAPMSRLLDDVLHILVFDLRSRNEDGDVVFVFIWIDPVELQYMEMGIQVQR